MARLCVLGAAFSFLALGCGSTDNSVEPREDSKALVEMGFTRGLMGSQVLLVWKDGSTEYSTAPNRVSRGRLSVEELQELQAIFSAGISAGALEELRSSGYRPGRSDAPEVELTLGNKDRLGFPVCESGPPISGKVQVVVEKLNELAGRHFEELSAQPFPVSTCGRSEP